MTEFEASTTPMGPHKGPKRCFGQLRDYRGYMHPLNSLTYTGMVGNCAHTARSRLQDWLSSLSDPSVRDALLTHTEFCFSCCLSTGKFWSAQQEASSTYVYSSYPRTFPNKRSNPLFTYILEIYVYRALLFWCVVWWGFRQEVVHTSTPTPHLHTSRRLSIKPSRESSHHLEFWKCRNQHAFLWLARRVSRTFPSPKSLLI